MTILYESAAFMLGYIQGNGSFLVNHIFTKLGNKRMELKANSSTAVLFTLVLVHQRDDSHDITGHVRYCPPSLLYFLNYMYYEQADDWLQCYCFNTRNACQINCLLAKPCKRQDPACTVRVLQHYGLTMQCLGLHL